MQGGGRSPASGHCSGAGSSSNGQRPAWPACNRPMWARGWHPNTPHSIDRPHQVHCILRLRRCNANSILCSAVACGWAKDLFIYTLTRYITCMCPRLWLVLLASQNASSSRPPVTEAVSCYYFALLHLFARTKHRSSVGQVGLFICFAINQKIQYWTMHLSAWQIVPTRKLMIYFGE